MPSGGTRRWLRWLERLAAAAVFAFLIGFLVANWRQVSAYEWQVDWPRLIASGALEALVYSGLVVSWRHILARLGGTLSIADAHRVWYLANLARYVPGKVLQLAGTAYMVRAKGVSPVLGVASSMVAQAFVLGTGCAVAALTLPETVNGAFGLPAGSLVAAVFLLVLLTPAYGAVMRLGLRLARRPGHFQAVPWRERAGLAAGYFVLWILMGLSFWLFLSAVTPVAADAVPGIVGVRAAGYLLGYLAVFVPGGLGVREGVYALLLGLYIPPTIAVAAAILARLWTTVVEVLVAGLLVAVYGTADLRASADPSSGDARG